MTPTDDSPGPGGSTARRPAQVYVFGALALLFLLVGLTGGSFQGKLSDVQKNDNSSFTPASADSTKVADAVGAFSPTQTIPGFMIFERDGGLTGADTRFITQRLAQVRKIDGVAADQVSSAPDISTAGPKAGAVASIAVPLVAKQDGTSRTGPELVDTEKAVIAAAEQGAPDGLRVLSAGPGGVLVAFIDAFAGLDGTLLLAAGIVVIVILLFVYRSPVLWFFPLFSAVMALGVSSIFVYALATNGVITLNGQSQGILDVLVIGAGTDYALLLISRYREELHGYESRVAAMTAAWKGVAPAIGASGITVILGLLCLSFAQLRSTAGLGPVCAIGIAATVLVMLTVLPALLVISGRWIFWPKRPAVDHRMDIASTHPVWSRYSRSLVGTRRRNWIAATVVLLLCAFGLTQLRTDGLSSVDGFTSDPPAVVGQHLFEQAFPEAQGQGAPADILVAADRAQAVIAAARRVQGCRRPRTGYACRPTTPPSPRPRSPTRPPFVPWALSARPHGSRCSRATGGCCSPRRSPTPMTRPRPTPPSIGCARPSPRFPGPTPSSGAARPPTSTSRPPRVTIAT